jgi:hypothetical protein
MQESVSDIGFPPGEPLRVLLDACLKEDGVMMTCDVDMDSWFAFSSMNSRKFVLQSHPAYLELSVIERVQSPLFKQPASMLTHGEIMEAMYSKWLFDAQKSKSSGILKHQAKHLSK